MFYEIITIIIIILKMNFRSVYFERIYESLNWITYQFNYTYYYNFYEKWIIVKGIISKDSTVRKIVNLLFNYF